MLGNKHTQSRARRNGANVPLAVAVAWANGQSALLADAHVEQALIPAAICQHHFPLQMSRIAFVCALPFDDHASSQLEAKRGSAVVT